jgi:hypothetical protein
MRRTLLVAGAMVAVLMGFGALAQTAHMTMETCIRASDAGQVCLASDGGVDTYSRACEVQNNGSTTLYCALQNKGDASPLHARQIASGGGTWSMDVAGQTAVWCIPGGGIDQQTALNSGGSTADGGPAGCTVSTVAH